MDKKGFSDRVWYAASLTTLYGVYPTLRAAIKAHKVAAPVKRRTTGLYELLQGQPDSTHRPTVYVFQREVGIKEGFDWVVTACWVSICSLNVGQNFDGTWSVCRAGGFLHGAHPWFPSYANRNDAMNERKRLAVIYADRHIQTKYRGKAKK